MHILKILLLNSRAATSIEYGLIASLIAVAIMTTVGNLGSQLKHTFSKTSSSLSTTNAA